MKEIKNKQGRLIMVEDGDYENIIWELNVGQECIEWFANIINTEIVINFSYIKDEKKREIAKKEYLILQKNALSIIQQART